MADYAAVSRSRHFVASTGGDTVTFTGGRNAVEIVNRQGAGTVYVSLDGTTPTVAGDDEEMIPAVAGSALLLKVPAGAVSPTVVKLIVDVATAVSVISQ